MFERFLQKNNKKVIINQQKPMFSPAKDMQEDTRPNGTLEELRKQSRDEIPRVKVFPFRLLEMNDIMIPYTASAKEIKSYLYKDMRHFEVGVLALAWKGNKESFQIMCEQLRNTDYYRRKSTLEYIVYHDLFEKNTQVLGEAVLDGHELVVQSALEKVLQFRVRGLQEEVKIALECWPDHKEIQNLCCDILTDYKENVEHILKKQKNEEEQRERENRIYQKSSQCIVKEQMEKPKKLKEYLEIIHSYFPNYSVDEAKALIEELAKEGCGYATLATTLVQWFATKEDLFRYQFGYSIQQENEYITDRLMLDFYCMTDEPGRGMSFEDMSERFQKYCTYYQLKVKLEAVREMDEKAYQTYVKNGYILLFAGNLTMYFKKYKPVHVQGWHVMNVSDVQTDGTITVVSWGKKYTLKKEDIKCKGWHFVYVCYC